GDVIRTIIMIAALCVFCYSGYQLFTICQEYKKGSDEYSALEEKYILQEDGMLEQVEAEEPTMKNPIDFDGLKALIRHAKIDVKNKSVLILGTGGSSNTAYAAAHSLGAKSITKVSRSGKNGAITYEQAKDWGADVIINTTPCGMYPDCGSKPLELSDYENLSGVCDLIFNPLRTMLVLEARQSGIPAEGGLYMLVLQAVRAYEFFTGDKCTDGLCEKIFKALTKQKQNIVLTGMPASGKSTVGKIIAKRLSRDFIDIDDEIVRSEGRSIPRIFAESGEEYFRDAETKAILEASKRTGAVIATGGGAVLRPENITALKQNGRIYFRDRALGSLIPTSDRPTADSSDALAKRYEERYPIYVKTADFRVTAQDTAEHAADQIEEDFSK
ncbi:MAG: shikimate kinase, partial [Acutalibacteraceae bacterium]